MRSGWAFIRSILQDQSPPDKWLPVTIAPSDGGLEVCVMDKRGSHAWCSRSTKAELIGWMLRRKSASTYSRPIGANGPTIAKLISLSFILVVRRQFFLLCLLLGEKAYFHCTLCRIGFCFQQFVEPVDICLDNPSHINSHSRPSIDTVTAGSLGRSRVSAPTIWFKSGRRSASGALGDPLARRSDRTHRLRPYHRRVESLSVADFTN